MNKMSCREKSVHVVDKSVFSHAKARASRLLHV